MFLHACRASILLLSVPFDGMCDHWLAKRQRPKKTSWNIVSGHDMTNANDAVVRENHAKIPIDLMLFLGPMYVIFPLCGGSSPSQSSFLFRNTSHLISMDPKKADSFANVIFINPIYTLYSDIVVFMGMFPFRGLFLVKQLGYRIFPYDPSILGRCYSWHIASPRSRPRNQYGRRKHNSHHFSTAPRTPSNYHFSGAMLNFRGVINEHFFLGWVCFPVKMTVKRTISVILMFLHHVFPVFGGFGR